MPSTKVSPSLQGFRIALTVDAEDAFSPAQQLRDLEASLFFYPVAQVLPPDSYDEFDAALQRCADGEIDWLLLTTPCAVETAAKRMADLAIVPTQLAQLKVACYGAKTQHNAATLFPAWQCALAHLGSHEQMIEAMQLSAEDSVVVPVAQHSHADWPKLLRSTGAETLAVPGYRLLLGRSGDDLPGMLWAGLVDAVVFLTENSVRYFVIRLKAEGGSPDMLADVTIACLDPQTASAAQAYGFHVQVLPTQEGYTSLAEALATYFSAQSIDS